MQQLRPTFSESWYRVADLKARLRASAQISRQHYRGDRWYVVRDPAGNQFHRLSAAAYRFVGLLDGSRTVAEAWDLVGGQLADDAPTQNEVIQILTQLHAANLMEANITPDATVLLRRHKKMQRQQWQGRMMNVLFPRIPLWDLDSFLCKWLPIVRPFLSWFGALVWIGVVCSAIFMLIPKWPELKNTAEHLVQNPQDWPFLWASFVLIKLIHELGHAFSCRRFGGEVHELGIMFLVFIPTPYVDASTAWSFPSKWARMFVGAGGMIIELFVAAIMAFVWAYTADGTVHNLAYNIMLIASVSTLIFNANPLLRYDGYYILSDWLEIPNLRYRATEYSMGLIKRHLFRIKSQQPLPPPGQRIWLFVYAIASSIYRIMVGITIILVVSQRVPVLGVLMALGGVATWLIVPVFKTANYLLLDPELHRKRAMAIGWTLGFAAAVIAMVGFIPMPVHYQAYGVVEPVHKEDLRPRTAGVVIKILKHDRDQVKEGDPILVLDDPHITEAIEELEAQIFAMKVKIEVDRALKIQDLGSDDQELKGLKLELTMNRERQDWLTIKAPFDGELVAPDLKDKMGQYLRPDDQVGTVQDVSQLRIRTLIEKVDEAMPFREQDDHPKVRLADNLTVDLTAEMEKGLPVEVMDVPPLFFQQNGGPFEGDPTDKSGRRLKQAQLQFYLSLDNSNGEIIPGQRAFIRFNLAKKPLISEWSRRIRQLIQEHSHGKWL